MQERVSIVNLKAWGQWKNDSTSYNFVEVTKSIFVQLKLTEESKAFSSTLTTNACPCSNQSEVRGEREIFKGVLNRSLNPAFLGSCPDAGELMAWEDFLELKMVQPTK